MTSTKTVNVNTTIDKLKTEIKHSSRGTFTTCKVALLQMALGALEQQQAEIAAYAQYAGQEKTQGEEVSS